VPAIPEHVRGARFTGWGTALGHRTVTNDDLAATMDTNDAWIRERTGIERRHIGGTNAELSTASGSKALSMAGIDPASIDALVLATTTPDRAVPATSSTVQHALGLRWGAFDINAGCSGFVYALVNAHGLIAMGAERVLLIGTDILSRITDWTDRNTAVLFADGSGAAVLEAGPGQLLGWDLDADGSAEEALYCEHSGFIQMDGKEVFRRAVRIMVDSAQKSMRHAGLEAKDISLIVPHQANIRIIQSTARKLKLPMEKVVLTVQDHGNTSAASIPLAMDAAVRSGDIQPGHNLLLEGVGGGFTWGAVLVKF